MPNNQRGVAPVFLIILALILSGFLLTANTPVTKNYSNSDQVLGKGSDDSGSSGSSGGSDSGSGSSGSTSGSGSSTSSGSGDSSSETPKPVVTTSKSGATSGRSNSTIKIKEVEKAENKKVGKREDQEIEVENELEDEISELEDEVEHLGTGSAEFRSKNNELEVELKEASGSTRSQKARENKIKIKDKNETGETEVEFRIKGNLLEFEASGEAALSRFPLSLDQDGQLFVRTGNGLKQIRILPDQAAEVAKKAGVQNQIEKIELTENSAQSEMVFKVKGIKAGKLFGIIPVSGETEAEVNTQTGAISTVTQPLWMRLLSSLII